LGVTPSAWFSNRKALQIGGSVGVVAAAGLNFDQYTNGYIDASTVERYYQAGAANKFSADNGAFKFFTAPSGTAGNAISFTQAMTLDASGNLLIADTTQTGAPFSNKLYVNGTASMRGTFSSYVSEGLFAANARPSTILTPSFASLRFGYQDDGGGQYNPAIGFRAPSTLGTGQTDYSNAIWTTTNGALAFGTSTGGANTERARIDSSGNFLWNCTTTGVAVDGCRFTSNVLQVSRTDADSVSANRNGSNGNVANWYKSGVLVGTVSVTGSATSYNTSSDYRLKNTIAPMTGALAKVALLKPCTYKWNADGSDGEGFIAHELQAVVPDAVTGEKDAVDAEGKPVYQGIDTSFLVATLTAAIQELKAEFDAYKASHP
jgi:hypothetical protein